MRGRQPAMAAPEEEIELDVRTKWQHEAHDFTPWLAGNLDLLSEELGMKLELVQQEAPVGPFYLDILAREAASGVIAIENQLEETDLNCHATGSTRTSRYRPNFGYGRPGPAPAQRMVEGEDQVLRRQGPGGG